MADRYFADFPISGDEAVLTGPEAHHLIHVMRAAPDLEVVLFDGSGAEFVGRVVKVGRTEVRIALLSRRVVDRELPLDLTLGVSFPKGDRQKWLVEKAVELGVRQIVPLRTARSVAQPVESVLARLRRTVIEASKQCGRNRLLEIAPSQDWDHLVAWRPDAAYRLVAHPGDPTAGAEPSLWRASGPNRAWTGGVIGAIGPEGGFTAEEITLAVAAGWQTVDLGPRTLRVETAAIWLAALVRGAFGSRPEAELRGES